MPDLHAIFTEFLATLPADRRVNLLPGMSVSEIQSVESQLASVKPDTKLPKSLKTIYAICGGQENIKYENFLFHTFTLIPFKSFTAVYLELCNAHEREFRPYETPGTRPWFDSRFFPFGYSPGESGCLRCIDQESEEIYYFDDDGGLLAKPDYPGIQAVFRDAANLNAGNCNCCLPKR